MNWLQEVGAYFPRDSGADLPRPVMHMFISEQHKILYSPVAKCACTSLKHLMVDLSGVEHRGIIFKFDVHRVTTNFNTGARLKDHASETVNKVLCSDEFYKFAVIREPVNRTISAYSEKFLVNRSLPDNILHTIDSIRSVRSQSAADTHQGITFREFVNHLLSRDPLDLDPHWGPQHYNLGGVDRYNDVFCIEQLDLLAARLTEWTGQNISLGKHNTSLEIAATPPDTLPGRYVDKLPSELDGMGNLYPSDFMEPALVARLQDYFSEDLALYNKARVGLSDYQPQQAWKKSSDSPVATSPIRDATAIARSVTLYSKGFFALDYSGRSTLQVLILNSRSRPLELGAVGPCHLVYRFRDAVGNVIHPVQYHTLNISKLEANGQWWESMEISIPPDINNVISGITVSMQIGDSFQIEDISPLHVTCAQPVRVP